jgi:hypothetical protein
VGDDVQLVYVPPSSLQRKVADVSASWNVNDASVAVVDGWVGPESMIGVGGPLGVHVDPLQVVVLLTSCPDCVVVVD